MTKSQATGAAKRLLRRMRTKGWRICVSENLGWHYCIENAGGHITVNPSCAGKFFCMMSAGQYQHTGCCDWSTDKTFKDPNAAVACTLGLAKAYADKTAKWIAHINKALGNV